MREITSYDARGPAKKKRAGEFASDP